MTIPKRSLSSHGGAALEVLLDLARVLAVEALEPRVQLPVPLVDEVHVGVRIESPPPRELGANVGAIRKEFK